MVGMFLFIVLFAYWMSRMISNLDMRIPILVISVIVLGIASLKIENGIMAIFIYLPFMAFIRRFIYSFSPYISIDPILIVCDMLIVLMFSYLIICEKSRISSFYANNRLVKASFILLLLFSLQIFNPLQGSLMVGLAGAKFYIVPLLWFFIGLFVSKKFIEKILYLVVIIGFITALYGLRQNFLGFTSFEKYWLEHSWFASLSVGGLTRIFSTFTNPTEFGDYLMIAEICVLALLLQSRRALPMGVTVIFVLIFAHFMVATRGSFFGFVIASFLFISLKSRNLKKSVITLLLSIIILAVLISTISYTRELDTMRDNRFLVPFSHALSGITNPSASTAPHKIMMWKQVFTTVFTRNPLGYGLGSDSLAAGKFAGHAYGSEHYVSSIFISSGLFGGILLIYIFYLFFTQSLNLWVKDSDRLVRTIIAIMFAYILLGCFVDYPLGGFGWLLIGWVAKRYTIREKDNAIKE